MFYDECIMCRYKILSSLNRDGGYPASLKIQSAFAATRQVRSTPYDTSSAVSDHLLKICRESNPYFHAFRSLGSIFKAEQPTEIRNSSSTCRRMQRGATCEHVVALMAKYLTSSALSADYQM